MDVILSFLVAFLYATACMILCGCGYQPPSRFGNIVNNALMFFFAVMLCLVCLTETDPETVGGYIAFGAYCLIMFLLWFLQAWATKDYVIDKDRVYDFHPMGIAKDIKGQKLYVGYIKNGISEMAVIVDNCEPSTDFKDVSFKVRYNGNLDKGSIRVEFYDKEKQRYVMHHFNIHVRKVEV